MYHTNVTGKTYYYQYFKTYTHDDRMLQNDERGEPIEFNCPRGKIHHLEWPLYNPDVIYIIDTKDDLSTSEQAAQQRIYNKCQNTQSNPPENCGCGTAAEIAYIGHHTSCLDFQYIHERESYEVLLAILKKTKKVTFADDSHRQTKRLRLDSTVENEDKDDGKEDTNALNEMHKVARAKEIQPIDLSKATTDSLTVLADAALATSNVMQSNIPSNSLPDLVGENIGGADCQSGEDDEVWKAQNFKICKKKTI